MENTPAIEEKVSDRIVVLVPLSLDKFILNLFVFSENRSPLTVRPLTEEQMKENLNKIQVKVSYKDGELWFFSTINDKYYTFSCSVTRNFDEDLQELLGTLHDIKYRLEKL